MAPACVCFHIKNHSINCAARNQTLVRRAFFLLSFLSALYYSLNMYQVLLFYKYVTIADPVLLMRELRALCERLKLTGRVLIASEGLNATIEGKTEDTEAFARELVSDERFSNIRVKRSRGTGNSFRKLSVKVKDEIVGTKFSPEEADPRVLTAPRLKPEELRSWYENGKDFVVVDMRNSYEYVSGHFKNAIDPGLENSRDLSAAVANLEPFKEKTVLTVCTGGVRCEKMSAYLMNKGFSDVYQLEDGIHAYMEKYPGKDFLGTLYTFDQRLTMHFGGEEREVIGRCTICGAKTEQYVNCMNNACHLHFLACTNCAPSGNVYCGLACEPAIAGGGE